MNLLGRGGRGREPGAASSCSRARRCCTGRTSRTRTSSARARPEPGRRARESSGRSSRSRASSATSPRTTRTSSSRSSSSPTCSAHDIDSAFSRLLRRPLVPEILGFDPRLQFVHEDDVTGGGSRTRRSATCPAQYNVAGDGPLPWSEVCRIARKRRTRPAAGRHTLAAAPLRYAHRRPAARAAEPAPRYGRAVDTSRFQRAGFRYQYTSAGTVRAFADGLRLERNVGRRSRLPLRARTSRRSSTIPPRASARAERHRRPDP